jgi:hypothetical protein
MTTTFYYGEIDTEAIINVIQFPPSFDIMRKDMRNIPMRFGVTKNNI